MTRAQVLAALGSSWTFVVEFIIDNNPETVMANLSAIDMLPAAPENVTRQQMFDAVLNLSQSQQAEVLAVPYIENRDNYTGGFEADLTPGIQATGVRAVGVTLAIITGITTLGAGFFGLQTSSNQADAQAAAAASAQAYSAAQEQNKILGLDPLVFAVVSVVIGAVLITSIVVISKRKR